jgi:hypothetical protein
VTGVHTWPERIMVAAMRHGRGGPLPALTRRVNMVAAARAFVICAATYHDWPDGRWVPFLVGLAAAVGGALLAGGASAAGLAPTWSSLPVALVVLLSAPAVHVARFANQRMPVTRELGRRLSGLAARTEQGTHEAECGDGRDVLTRSAIGPFRFLRLAETRTDSQHGGTVCLRTLRCTRSLV